MDRRAHALAIGLVQVNVASEFVSPIKSTATDRVTVRHRQPSDAARVVRKVRELPRRSAGGSAGFDAIGVVLLELRNDGSEVQLWQRDPSPEPGDAINYDTMIRRMANEYDATFRAI
jgi:hypothetical protein